MIVMIVIVNTNGQFELAERLKSYTKRYLWANTIQTMNGGIGVIYRR